jgi:hypothetical protein
MTSDQAQQRAERNFKKEERVRDGKNATMEYEVQARAIREKTARLKALRLAKEAETETAELADARRGGSTLPTARRKLTAL